MIERKRRGGVKKACFSLTRLRSEENTIALHKYMEMNTGE